MNRKEKYFCFGRSPAMKERNEWKRIANKKSITLNFRSRIFLYDNWNTIGIAFTGKRVRKRLKHEPECRERKQVFM